MNIQELVDEIVAFRDERDWEQFHTPDQLAAALSIEAAELQEIFLWKESEDAQAALKIDQTRIRAKRAIADVLIYAFLFCHVLGENPAALIRSKIEENAKKYPPEQSRGRPHKYTESKSDDD